VAGRGVEGAGKEREENDDIMIQCAVQHVRQRAM